jgi:hypothetical protein
MTKNSYKEIILYSIYSMEQKLIYSDIQELMYSEIPEEIYKNIELIYRDIPEEIYKNKEIMEWIMRYRYGYEHQLKNNYHIAYRGINWKKYNKYIIPINDQYCPDIIIKNNTIERYIIFVLFLYIIYNSC